LGVCWWVGGGGVVLVRVGELRENAQGLGGQKGRRQKELRTEGEKHARDKILKERKQGAEDSKAGGILFTKRLGNDSKKNLGEQ